jgi:hypothetical protein
MYEDKELKEYRDLLKTPDHFEEGFDWKTVVGAVFIGFLMMPGSMYLQLVIGTGIGPAARWVTIILFAEIAKRSYTELKQQEIFLLYYMAGAALASPLQGLLWNQYLVQSDAAVMLGLTEYIPTWVAPASGIGIPGRAHLFPPRLDDPDPAAGGCPDHSAHRPVRVGIRPLPHHLGCGKTALSHGTGGGFGHHGPGRIHRGEAEKLEMAGLLHRRGHRAGCSAASMSCCPRFPDCCSPSPSG